MGHKGPDSAHTPHKGYNGRIFSLRNTHPEVATCIDAESPAIVACYEEFKKINPLEGSGELPQVVNSVKAK